MSVSSVPVLYDSLLKADLPPPFSKDVPVSFYACGITPYAPAHLGHARSFVVFDFMARWLTEQGYRVRLIRNVTDIDDKIIKAAQEKGVNWHTFSHQQASVNRQWMTRLGVLDYEEPYASDYIAEIQDLIQKLLDKQHAYVSDVTGDVLFDVSSFAGAALMPHKEGSLLSENRVSAEGKRSAQDFVLWKPAKPDEPSWNSPWGLGRPGWHIECSAMIQSLLGDTVHYHGGGVDLKFPHHQAEIQQSEAAYDRPLAHRWVHHGSVRDKDGKKMSKSLGNYVELEDAWKDAELIAPGWGGVIVRFALLSSLWTRPLDWDGRLLKTAWSNVQTWMKASRTSKAEPELASELIEVLNDNLNTPKAFAILHQWAQQTEAGTHDYSGAIRYGLEVLGITQADVERFNNPMVQQWSDEVLGLVEKRKALRLQKQWQQADEIRDTLRQLGYEVKDR